MAEDNDECAQPVGASLRLLLPAAARCALFCCSCLPLRSCCLEVLFCQLFHSFAVVLARFQDAWQAMASGCTFDAARLAGCCLQVRVEQVSRRHGGEAGAPGS